MQAKVCKTFKVKSKHDSKYPTVGEYLSLYLFNDAGLSGFCQQVIQHEVCLNFFFVHITTSFDITLKETKIKNTHRHENVQEE